MFNTYLRMSWELFLFPCVIATLSLGKGRGTQPMRRRLRPLGLPEDSPPSLYFCLEYSASLDSVYMVLEMGRVMYLVCVDVFIASVRGCEDLAQDYTCTMCPAPSKHPWAFPL